MQDLKLAILIDADNISPKYVKVILDEAASFGVAACKRIYGDWSDARLKSWKDALLNNSIIPIQQYSYTTGKNATDSAMIIDAMDLLYSGNLDGFCIVSSDSDFTRLAARLRREWTQAGEAVAWAEPDGALTTRALADYARRGDPHALRLFEAAGAYLGRGIAIIADVLNPERVVIGGVYMRCEALLKDSMWRAIRSEALPHCWQELQVLPAGTGEQIGDFAAAMVAVYGLETQV